MEVLHAIRREGIETTVIVITAWGTPERAVEAMRAGAYDFIPKPLDPAHLEVVINKALERDSLREENRLLHGELESLDRPLIGESPTIQDLVRTAQQAAASNATILLRGESGTGKEILARAIHRWSPRRNRPLVTVNCVALSEELLESELFGHEKGAFTGRPSAKAGQGRAGRRRDAVPGRDRRHPPGHSRPSSSGCCRSRSSSGSAARDPSGWTCASSPPPTPIWNGR